MFTVHVAMLIFNVYVLQSGNWLTNYVQGWGTITLYTVDFIYMMLFLTLIFLSMHLTNRNKKFVPYIYITSTLLGVLSVMIFVLLAFEIFEVTSGSNSFLN